MIIAGRYGSLDPQGVSYTEKEYDYAVAKGIPVIALLHVNPASIESGKTEQTPEGKEKLAKFQEKAQGGRLSKEWRTPDDLAGLVSRALHISFKRFPAIGWIRADKAASEDLLNEINAIRKENVQLKQELEALNKTPSVPKNLASLDDEFEVNGHFTDYSYDFSQEFTWKHIVAWRELFKRVSPYLMEIPEDSYVKELMASNIAPPPNSASYTHINDQDFQTIKLQFQAQKLVETERLKTADGSYKLHWSLTPSGKDLAFDLRTVKKE